LEKEICLFFIAWHVGQRTSKLSGELFFQLPSL